MDILELIIIIGIVSLVQIIIIKIFTYNPDDIILDNELLKKQRDILSDNVKQQSQLIKKYQDKNRNYKKLITDQQAIIKKYKAKNRKKATKIMKLQKSLKNNKYQIHSLKQKLDKLKEANLDLVVKNMKLKQKEPSYYYDEIRQTLEKMNKEDSDPYLLDKRHVEEL